MKKMAPLMTVLVVAFAGLTFTGNPGIAGEGTKRDIVVAALNSGGFCPRMNEGRSCGSNAAHRPHVRGVLGELMSCGSNEWCCKHDIGGTGACVQCCSR
jgi:hypothetical protein